MSWQKCPICNGSGIDSLTSMCPVCLGHRIISELTGKPPSDIPKLHITRPPFVDKLIPPPNLQNPSWIQPEDVPSYAKEEELVFEEEKAGREEANTNALIDKWMGEPKKIESINNLEEDNLPNEVKRALEIIKDYENTAKIFSNVEPCDTNPRLCSFPTEPYSKEDIDNYKKRAEEYKHMRDKLKYDEAIIPGAGPN